MCRRPADRLGRQVLLFSVAVDAGYTWLALLAVVNTVVSLAYYLRVLAPSDFEPLPGPVLVLGRWAGGATVASASAWWRSASPPSRSSRRWPGAPRCPEASCQVCLRSELTRGPAHLYLLA